MFSHNGTNGQKSTA